MMTIDMRNPLLWIVGNGLYDISIELQRSRLGNGLRNLNSGIGIGASLDV